MSAYSNEMGAFGLREHRSDAYYVKIEHDCFTFFKYLYCISICVMNRKFCDPQ